MAPPVFNLYGMIPKGAYFEILRVELVRLRLWGFIRIDGKALSAFKKAFSLRINFAPRASKSPQEL